MKSPNYEETFVYRESIYNIIYPRTVSGLRKKMTICLRQGNSTSVSALAV